MKLKSVILATTALGFLVAGTMPGHANCRSEEQAITQRIQQASQQMSSGSGICSAARSVQVVFQDALAFYQRCPINDPDGQMRNYSRQMIQWGRDAARSACAN